MFISGKNPNKLATKYKQTETLSIFKSKLYHLLYYIEPYSIDEFLDDNFVDLLSTKAI